MTDPTPFIDRYLRGELTTAELTAFEDHLASDTQLANEVRFRKSVRQATSDHTRSALVKRFQSWDEEDEAASNAKPAVRRIRWWQIAAVLLPLAGLTALLMRKSPPDLQNLYAQHFDPFPNVVAPTTRGSDFETSLQQAYAAYEAGHYVEAIPLFEAQPSDTTRFYLALCLLVSDQDDRAQQVLSDLTELHGFRFQEASTWYLALAHLKKGDLDRTQALLQTIADRTEGIFSARARSLLDKVKQ